MSTNHEKLCMAIIKHAIISNIDWDGVGKEMGGISGNAANCQYRRLKKVFERNKIATEGDDEDEESGKAKGVNKRPAVKKGKEVGRGRAVKVKEEEMRETEIEKCGEFAGDDTDEESGGVKLY